ncbi:MAG: hypothetical protein ACFFAN_05360 [Promethearchaeota archaeon]
MICEKLNEIVERKTIYKHINGEMDDIYINRLYELFEITLDKLLECNLNVILKNGIKYFLIWNKMNPNLKIQKFSKIITIENEEITEYDVYNILDREQMENTIEDFLMRLESVEIRLILVGFCFWGILNKILEDSNEIIFVSYEKLPIVNLKIFEILTKLIIKAKINIKDINNLVIKDIYNDIYDKTEGFKIKIEPWLNF